jgi:hypothetical protein
MNLHKIQNIVTEGGWGRMGLSPGFSDRSHLPFLNDGSMKNEWWFSIIDVIEILTGNDRPRKYWSDLKNILVLGRTCSWPSAAGMSTANG